MTPPARLMRAPTSCLSSTWRIGGSNPARWVARRIGRANSATAGVTTIDLGGAGVIANASLGYVQRSFNVIVDGVILGDTWNTLMGGSPISGASLSRGNFAVYSSPTVGGFNVQAAWGENDVWDAALRYAGEFSGIRVAAGVGYIHNSNGLTEITADIPSVNAPQPNQWKGSASILHVPSGLYLTGAYLRQDNDKDDGALGGSRRDTTLWYAQAGISKNYFGLGNTVLYGEYARIDDGINSSSSSAGPVVPAGGLPNAFDSELTCGASASCSTSTRRPWSFSSPIRTSAPKQVYKGRLDRGAGHGRGLWRCSHQVLTEVHITLLDGRAAFGRPFCLWGGTSGNRQVTGAAPFVHPAGRGPDQVQIRSDWKSCPRWIPHVSAARLAPRGAPHRPSGTATHLSPNSARGAKQPAIREKVHKVDTRRPSSRHSEDYLGLGRSHATASKKVPGTAARSVWAGTNPEPRQLLTAFEALQSRTSVNTPHSRRPALSILGRIQCPQILPKHPHRVLRPLIPNSRPQTPA